MRLLLCFGWFLLFGLGGFGGFQNAWGQSSLEWSVVLWRSSEEGRSSLQGHRFHLAQHGKAELLGRKGALGHLQRKQVEGESLSMVYWAIGGTMAGLITVPLVGNIHALATGKGQSGWGIGGLIAVGFLTCMVGYIAGTSGFFPHKDYWVAQLPMLGLSLGMTGLGIANLAIHGKMQSRSRWVPSRGALPEGTAQTLFVTP
ncbi:MAG: hypothetical protein EP343_21800 [Deltaproteobacteria bacterium]|nr:MAG: hypothetical protein EP343_21800 [Deltaproteobacteria bacterium]